MSLRPKDRFEVFKRDGFTCQYCVRRTPEVVLEVDHIIPRAEGGSDGTENLLTACWDCNRGKGARLLDDRAPALNIPEQTELVREREAQLREYHAVKEAEAERKNAQFGEVWNYWFQAWGAASLPRYHTPWESVLRSNIERLGVSEVKEAVDITADRFKYVSANAVRYFAGVLRRKLAEQEGRVVTCSYCAKRIVLTPEQVASDGIEGWYHTSCKPETDG